MKVPRVLGARLAEWQDTFDRIGYEPERMTVEDRTLPGGASRWQLLARASRLRTYGGATVSIDVSEEWQAETEAQRGLPNIGGWHLRRGTYHAQMGDPDGSSAERVDVDPRGNPHPLIHRHPHGRPNDVREPLTHLPHPAQWLHGIEEILIRTYCQTDRT